VLPGGEDLPASQVAQADNPDEEYSPAEHVPEQAAVFKPFASVPPYVPAGQGRHAVPPREYLPLSQFTLHDKLEVLPAASVDLPAGHDVQTVDSVVSIEDAPVRAYLPIGQPLFGRAVQEAARC